MGTNKPKDLGVKATVAEYNTYIEKAGTELKHVSEAPVPGKSFVASGKKDIKVSFSQEEISGRVNFAQWRHMPVDNVQVRINNDGTGEVAGVLRIDRLSGFISTMGFGSVSQADIAEALKYVGIAGNPPFYAKVKASVKDNRSQVSLLSGEVGRFPVPVDDINKSGVLSVITNEIISKVDGLYAKTVTFENGKMNFDGMVPASMTVQE